MVNTWLTRLRSGLLELREFLDEKGIGAANREFSRLYRFAHFWLRVAKSFSSNRCPIRASALAYTSLLALIPMLAVAFSVSTGLLKQDGEKKIYSIIEKVVETITPPAVLSTNANAEIVGVVATARTAAPAAAGTNTDRAAAGATNFTSIAATTEDAADRGVDFRRQVARTINELIQHSSSGTLGLTGMLLLIVAAVSMLSRIEETFNDIWGVAQGRGWFTRIVQYWAVVTLLPVLLAVGLGLAGARDVENTKAMLHAMPVIGAIVFQLLPVAVLCVSFAVFYVLIPNTKVRWDAAIVGGLVGGVLWHLNNRISVLYVSQVVTNSKIYGSLGIIPVLMLGLYFSWLILLFGAQVAYAYQNRVAYLQEKQCETVNQRGREFIALRIMACVGQRFLLGERPATIPEISGQLAVPTALLQQLMQVLIASQLVVEVAGKEAAFAPARSLDAITCHDILRALRAGQGQEMATSDEPARAEIYGEFQRILEAERQAASSVTVLAMAQCKVPAVAAVSDAPRALENQKEL